MNKNISNFKKVTKLSFRLICKNLFVNFLVAIFLTASCTAGLLYVQNYRDGTRIAEEKAEKALAKERNKIGEDAISYYKKSPAFREDASKIIAENITSLDIMNFLYNNIKSESLKKYPQLKIFYTEFLKEGHKQYREINN